MSMTETLEHWPDCALTPCDCGGYTRLTESDPKDGSDGDDGA